jgi:hypothetical protein
MRKLLWLPAILGLGLFFRNKDKVADLIDTGDWGRALIYIAFAAVGAICAILAIRGGSRRSTKTNSSAHEMQNREPKE